jgi:hypothetical protein
MYTHLHWNKSNQNWLVWSHNNATECVELYGYLQTITPNPKKPMIALSIGKEKLHPIHRILRLQIYGAGQVNHG